MIEAMRSTPRKAKVTSETKLESQKLREIWEATPNRPSQAVFGETYEIGSQTAIATFLAGTTPISKKAAVGFAKGLKCRIEDFSPRLAAEIAGMSNSIDIVANAELIRRLESASPETKRLIEIALMPDVDLEQTPLSPSLKGLVGAVKALVKEEINRGDHNKPT